MRIFNLGLEIEPGKYKYKEPYFDTLVAKYEPKTETLYSVEFLNDEPERCDAVVFAAAKKLDLIVGDLDKIERRLERQPETAERDVLLRSQALLESETLLCDGGFGPEADAILKPLGLLTYKPCVGVGGQVSVPEVIGQVLAKARVILFYTAGKKEVRAWELGEGESILEAAGKIHSDLKRGFIKAEIIHAKDVPLFFNAAEARARGLVETVGREYIVAAQDIIEIKFNV